MIEEFLYILISGLHFAEIASMILENISVSAGTVLVVLYDFVIIQLVEAVSSCGEIDWSFVVPWCKESSYSVILIKMVTDWRVHRWVIRHKEASVIVNNILITS